MTIVICEDEFHFAAHLQDIVRQYLQQKELSATVLLYSSGEEFLCSNSTPDIILMDIKLSGKNGMDTMKSLRAAGCRSQVIFITAYPEYVFQAFDVDAIQYLEKPINQTKLFSALDKAWSRAMSDQGKTILLTSRATVSRVRIKDIVYCEVFNHQTILYTMTGRYSYSGTLDSLEPKLDNRFFRCHRSYLVNLDYVVDKEPGVAVLVGGSKVFISRRKQQEFTMRLLESCRRGE